MVLPSVSGTNDNSETQKIFLREDSRKEEERALLRED